MRTLSLAVPAVVAAVALSACGTVTPDVEGETLRQARQDLTKAGVKESNIIVKTSLPGQTATPSMTVCDHDPDGVSPKKRTTLIVAANCTGNEDAGGDPDDHADSYSSPSKTKTSKSKTSKSFTTKKPSKAKTTK